MKKDANSNLTPMTYAWWLLWKIILTNSHHKQFRNIKKNLHKRFAILQVLRMFKADEMSLFEFRKLFLLLLLLYCFPQFWCHHECECFAKKKTVEFESWMRIHAAFKSQVRINPFISIKTTNKIREKSGHHVLPKIKSQHSQSKLFVLCVSCMVCTVHVVICVFVGALEKYHRKWHKAPSVLETDSTIIHGDDDEERVREWERWTRKMLKHEQ